MARDVRLANSTTNPTYVADLATPLTTGGLSATQIISAASNNATLIKGSAGQVYKVVAWNRDATARAYVKLYNVSTAPAVSTDTPVITIPLDLNAATEEDLKSVDVAYGIAFTTGIGASIVLSAGATGNTSVGAANDVIVNIFYK